jgi:MFS family permease
MPGIFPALLVSTTVLSSIDIVVTYLPALGEERGWAVSVVGGLLALRAASSMVVRLILGELAVRLGRQPLLVGSMIVSALALIATPFLGPIPLVGVAMVLAGAGLGIGQPLTMSWVASAAPPQVRATALAVRIMGNGVGRIGLPIVAGTVAAFAGAAGVLGVTGGVVALSLATFAGRRRPRRRAGGPNSSAGDGGGASGTVGRA